MTAMPMIWCMEENSAKHLGALSLRNVTQTQDDLVKYFDTSLGRSMLLPMSTQSGKLFGTLLQIDYFSLLPAELHDEITNRWVSAIASRLAPENSAHKTEQAEKLIGELTNYYCIRSSKSFAIKQYGIIPKK